MSRRGRHGRQPHPSPAARPARPGTTFDRPATSADSRANGQNSEQGSVLPPPTGSGQRVDSSASPASNGHAELPPAAQLTPIAPRPVPDAPVMAPQSLPAPAPGPVAAMARSAAPLPALEAPPAVQANGGGGDGRNTTCTTAQLRRFIKSRPWVPMHELRRRFGIWGGDDDVTPMRVGDRTLFIGLPPAEGRMVAELLAGGDVGYELSLDPITPVVVGVYPMRPVPRS